jgi:hypothetical protein
LDYLINKHDASRTSGSVSRVSNFSRNRYQEVSRSISNNEKLNSSKKDNRK